MQKILYLYGFPEIEINDELEQPVDDGTMNLLIMCFASMSGVAEATKMIQKVAGMLAKGVQKRMMAVALTKLAVWKPLKKLLSFFAIKLTKDLASKTVANSIVALGGVLIGGITYVTFSKNCNNLINGVKDTILSNPDLFKDDEIVDTEYTVESVYDELTNGITFDSLYNQENDENITE